VNYSEDGSKTKEILGIAGHKKRRSVNRRDVSVSHTDINATGNHKGSTVG